MGKMKIWRKKMETIADTNAFNAGVKEKKHENKQNYNC
jgi:hypothetical protein